MIALYVMRSKAWKASHSGHGFLPTQWAMFNLKEKQNCIWGANEMFQKKYKQRWWKIETFLRWNYIFGYKT